MIEGMSIICFAHDWEGDPTSKTHIMRILAKRNRVLWVNSIGMRRPNASSRDLRRIVTKLQKSFAGCIEMEPNILVTNPLVVPLPGFALADRLNTYILVKWLRRLCRRHGFERPILWTFLPNTNYLVGHLDEHMVIYHCVDEYSAFSGVAREVLIQMEHDLIRRAHVVITSSEKLCNERRSINPNTHFVSHGVDVAHFAKAFDPATDVPDDIRCLPRPVVGYFGLLADWLDLPIMRALALKRPGWSFAMVGKAVTDMGPLQGLPNVYMLGQKPYSALPAYCRGFDVGVIPFRINELTVRANPLKLREYLAAGLPVVSTPLPEVTRYRGLVYTAEGVEAFIERIEAALDGRSMENVQRRVEAMQSEGWEVRVEEISALISAHLGVTT